MAADLAIVKDIEEAWRPLTKVEQDRALHYIGRASRKVRRRFPDVDQRVTSISDPLTDEDVKDVIVAMVLSVIPAPVVGARSWSQTSGPFSHSVTLPAMSASAPMSWEDWMIDVFDPLARRRSSAAFSFPDAGDWPDAATVGRGGRV